MEEVEVYKIMTDVLVWIALSLGAVYAASVTWFIKNMNADFKKHKEELPKTLSNYATRSDLTLRRCSCGSLR